MFQKGLVMQKNKIYEETEQEIDLNKLDQRHQSEVFREKIFSGKDIKGIKFNSISFIKCAFDGAEISNCQFNNCVFSNCSFKGTVLKSSKFDEKTFIEKCSFTGTEITDVEMKSTLSQNTFTQDCKVKNFIYGSGPIDDISKITSVVESVQTQQKQGTVASEEAVQEQQQVEDLGQIEELESRQNSDIDFKLYNALFPEVLKLYPTLQKEEYGYGLTINNIEFSFSPDSDSYAWRYVFMVRDTDDSLGSDVVTVGTDKEITFDTIKEAFEQTIKGEASSIAQRTESQVIKNSLVEFVKEVFKAPLVTNENSSIVENILVDISDDPEDVKSIINNGYDMTSNKPCIIIGKVFTTSNKAEAEQVRTLIKKFNFIIKEDITDKNNEQLEAYSKENPYSCFIFEPDMIYQKVKIRTFGKNSVVGLI